jgi:DNA-binding response OmpR family regulator
MKVARATAPDAVPSTLSALIVEDNPTDILLLEQSLGRHVSSSHQAATLQQCREAIERQSFDVILLDLGLPDSKGLETLQAVRALAPDTAIVVLTGLDDEETGLAAMQSGAQDYLCKGQADTPALLARVIRYAVERHRRNLSADAERQKFEVRSVERLSEHPGTSVTATMYGGHTLRERNPEQFLDLFDRYRELLENAVEERTFKVEHTLEEDLRSICQSIASLRGSPRDVIEIHVASLKSAMESAPPARTTAYLEEGRILVLELMGYLAGFYRNYYPGLRGSNGSDVAVKERGLA